MVGLSNAAPRPLQLVTGPFMTSAAESSPSQLDLANSVGSPLGLGGVTSRRNATITTPCQTSSNVTVTALKHQLGRNPRRHSSISYIHSDSKAPSHSWRRESVDGFVRSSPPHKITAFDIRQKASSATTSDFQFGTSRSNSATALKKKNLPKNLVTERWGTELDILESTKTEGTKHSKERHPLTLVEKHAELLHFIAQKEAKCLELRSQLATHEAELLQLKRKWERIIHRGLEKPHNPTSPTCSSQHPSPSSTSSGASTGPQSAPVVNTHAPVLEGIKEGVQGVGRLLAAGLESIAGGVEISFSALEVEPPPPPPLVVNSTKKSARKGLKLGHGINNESQSSSSTSASALSSPPSSMRTSVTSVASSSSHHPLVGKNRPPAVEPTSPSEASYPEERPSMETTSSSDFSEQVLFVRDTGATPTMSPNPDFEQRRARQRSTKGRGKSSRSPVSESLQRGGLIMSEDSWPSWDDVSTTTTSSGAEKPDLTGENDVLKPSVPTTTASSSKSTLSDHNLSVDATGGATQQQQQQHLSSWVDTVGKKWGEFKGTSTSTFVKNQKRASLLLSDMQNSFVTALIASPPPLSPGLSSRGTSSAASSKWSEKQRPASLSFASNSASVISPLSQYRRSKAVPSSNSTQPSLLDDFDNEADAQDERDRPRLLTAPLVPSSPMVCTLRKNDGFHNKRDKIEQSSEDDWNW